jgi:hypothetical protein
MIEETDDTSALYRAMAQRSKEKRENNRQGSTRMLEQYEIPFTSLNNGAHLLIQYQVPVLCIDFWPGTGLWRVRYTQPEVKRRGVKNLIRYVQNATELLPP